MFRGTTSIVCLLQLCSIAYTLPAEQQPILQPFESVQFVRSELKKAEIIPTVIDDFLPSLTVDITWSKKHAKLGNTIKPKHLQEQPAVALHDITPSSSSSTTKHNLSYVVTLTDPDAPSRDDPKWSEMCHWIASNVTLSETLLSIPPLPDLHLLTNTASLDAQGPQDVIAYKPPGPPPKTGKHRYVFLVFAPKNGTSEPLHLSRPGDRQHWGTGRERGGVRDWAVKNGLVPVAANFLYAQNKKQ
ncbi:hypothetical protein ACN47E_009111 [Coniothyrium glycines]